MKELFLSFLIERLYDLYQKGRVGSPNLQAFQAFFRDNWLGTFPARWDPDGQSDQHGLAYGQGIVFDPCGDMARLSALCEEE